MVTNRTTIGIGNGIGFKNNNIGNRIPNIPGLVALYEAYDKTNEDTDKDILKDLSGNGYDIQLKNFAFSEGSGYGKYALNFKYWQYSETKCTINKNKIIIYNTISSKRLIRVYNSFSVNTKIKITLKISGIPKEITDFRLLNESIKIGGESLSIPLVNGINEIDTYIADEGRWHTLYFIGTVPKGFNDFEIIIEQIPEYKGALVSDGIDDYGECIKDFTLPNDYTVLSIREKIDSENITGCTIAKSSAVERGAFITDYKSLNVGYSYGDTIAGETANLFSYQSKSIRDGKPGTPGTGIDENIDKLKLFTWGGFYSKIALYSFAIFDHTLTNDELSIFKDYMMSKFVSKTKILDTIEYYDILDAKNRSNDESDDTKNKWIGKYKKINIDLKNYAFSEMSGWNGNIFDLRKGRTDYESSIDYIYKTADKIIFSGIDNLNVNAWTCLYFLTMDIKENTLINIKINGLQEEEMFAIRSGTDGTLLNSINHDGVLSIITTKDYTYLRFDINNIKNKINRKFIIESIPSYPAALVSDGIDDYGISKEIINENIGTIIAHYKFLDNNDDKNRFLFSAKGSLIDNRIILYKSNINSYIIAMPYQKTVNDGINYLTREPLNPNGNLYISIYELNYNIYSKNVLYQLRLIKNKLNETQLNTIKWQIDKEYRDYLKLKGWNI